MLRNEKKIADEARKKNNLLIDKD